MTEFLGPKDRNDLNFSSLERTNSELEQISPIEPPSILIRPKRDESQRNFEAFNPFTVSKEEFDNLPGSIQEFALKQLIRTEFETETVGKNGSTDQQEQVKFAEKSRLANKAIGRLRPDFEIQTPLSPYEIKLTEAIDRITASPESIDANVNRGTFQFIKTFLARPKPLVAESGVFDIEGYEVLLKKADSKLQSVLEEEKRRRGEYPDNLFYPQQEVGTYHPGRRYRSLLERQVSKEIEEEKTASLRERIENEKESL